jgi:hypothetical protein
MTRSSARPRRAGSAAWDIRAPAWARPTVPSTGYQDGRQRQAAMLANPRLGGPR